MLVDGGCHCGALKFAAEINPDRVVICHCTDCQITSGSAFRTIVQAKAADFKMLQGTPKIYEKIGESGNRRALAFCAECGSHIFATSAEEPRQFYALRVGTIAQCNELKPSMQVWCQSQLSWLGQIPEMTAIEKQ
jgi:hypothetical protein